MTKAQFRKGINSELKAANFNNKVVKVGEEGVNTTMLFDGMTFGLVKWLNNRFQYGISTSKTTDYLIYINTPLQGKTEI